MLEYPSWADALVGDHELLRQLVQRFKRSNVRSERALLLRLVQDIYEMHRSFEVAWMYTDWLQSRHPELYILEQLLDVAPVHSPEWNKAADEWTATVLKRTNLDECCLDHRKISGASMLGWTSQLLEARASLLGEIHAVLANGPLC